MAFLGLFRGTELTELSWASLELAPRGVRVLVQSSKTDQYYQGATVLLPGHAEPALDVRTLLSRLRQHVPQARLVFCQQDGQALTVDTMRSRVKTYLGTFMSASDLARFSLHSFRRGGATAMAQQRIPIRLIKKHGRWLSDAVNVYLEADDEELSSAADQLGATLL